MKTTRFVNVLFLLILSGCYEISPCREYAARLFDKEVNAVITDTGPIGNSFRIKGFEPVTKSKVIYADVDGLYTYIHPEIEIGDTLVKEKGTDKFLLKKKSNNLLFSYNCEGDTTRGLKPVFLPK